MHTSSIHGEELRFQDHFSNYFFDFIIFNFGFKKKGARSCLHHREYPNQRNYGSYQICTVKECTLEQIKIEFFLSPYRTWIEYPSYSRSIEPAWCTYQQDFQFGSWFTEHPQFVDLSITSIKLLVWLTSEGPTSSYTDPHYISQYANKFVLLTFTIPRRNKST